MQNLSWGSKWISFDHERRLAPGNTNGGDLTVGEPVYRFVDSAIASTYDHKPWALLNRTPRQALNPSFTSLKIVLRF